MENNKVQSASKRYVTSKLPISSTNGQNIEGCSLKQVKLDDSSFDVPLLQERTCCGSERRVNCSSVTRPKFDLNVAEAAWEDSADKTTERFGSDRIELGSLRSNSSRSVSSFAMKSDGSDNTLRLPRLSQSTTDQHFDSGVDLDLQLKPPCKPGPKFSWLDTVPSVQDSSKDMTYLTLSLPGEVGPTTSVKPEPNEGNNRKNNREVELGLQKSTRPTNVKSEQCEVSTENVESIEASSISLRTNCGKEEKNESRPLEIEYQRHKGLQVSSPYVSPSRACREDLPDSYGSKILDSESKVEIDLNFMSADARDCLLHDDVPMHISPNVTLEAGKITEKGLDQASHSYIQNGSESRHYCEVPKSSCLNDDAKGNAEKASNSVSESLEFEENKLNVANDTPSGQYGLDHGLLLEFVATDGNKAMAAGVSHGNIVSESQDLKSSKIVAAAGALMESDGNCDVRECSEKIEASAEVDEASSSYEYEDVEVSADDSNEYEAVDLSVSNDEGENSVEQTEEMELQGEEATSYTPMTGPSMQPLNEDGHDVYIKKPEGCIDRDLGISTTEDLPLAFQTSGCSEKSLVYSTCRENDDSNDNARATDRGDPRNVSWQKGNAYRKDFVESGGARKQEKWRGKRGRFIKQYTGPNRTSFTKTEPDHSRPMSSHNKGGRFSDDQYRQDKSRFRWHREKRWYPKSETEKCPQQFGRRRPDFPRGRRHFNWHENVDVYASRTNYSLEGDRRVKRCAQDEIPHPSYPSSQRQAHDASERHTSGVQNASHSMLQDWIEERKSYERVENTRRSLSPVQHGPVHAFPDFPNSSLRSSDKPPCQWFPSGKSLQVHDRHAGLVHHRSSPPLRHNGMQLPLQPPVRHHYFAQKAVSRGHGSITGECGGGNRPAIEQFPKAVRSLQRDIDEKFGSNHPQNQGGDTQPYVEYDDNAEFVNDRRCIERQDITRPFRQQHYVEQQGPFVIEDNARRPNMYHPQMAEKLERGSHFPKAPHRIRFNDAQVKRRRY